MSLIYYCVELQEKKIKNTDGLIFHSGFQESIACFCSVLNMQQLICEFPETAQKALFRFRSPQQQQQQFVLSALTLTQRPFSEFIKTSRPIIVRVRHSVLSPPARPVSSFAHCSPVPLINIFMPQQCQTLY